MKSALPLLIGWRFYRARQRSGFVSFISFASTAGIALGVAVLILVLSAMNGFESELEKRLLGVVPQGELLSAGQPISDWRQMVADASAINGITAAAPMVKIQGLIQKPGGFAGIQITGVDPTLEQKVSALGNYLSQQGWQSLEGDANHIVMGQALLKKLGLKIGDSVTLYLPPPKSQSAATDIGRARSHTLVISGSFSVGGELDYANAYMPLAYAQKLMGLGDAVNAVRIKVARVFEAPRLIRELGYQQQQMLYISDWTRTQGHLYQDIQMVRTIMYLVLALVIAVACFNIVSTLVMAVRDKAAEIAILMTMGFSRKAMMAVFMVQGALNGVVGCAIGTVVGVLLARNLSAITAFIEKLTGHQFLSADVYFIDFLPSRLELSDVILVLLMALIMSLLATLYPAYRASRIAPARALAAR
ncbi:lipoprotein-releasing ABC transporter permease subunit LolE [Shewanella yunxiaonensis]|uniref:Lipoprotein-releasing ABC transporter permease subunit LolE n=1 Tax=Shewanella yunxiaonensis TaxID=2829809 RepID=A0ABX7YXP9_9GAMM|nr:MULTISPECIES: lipoprotein-releasing ABC transporter permease subunit LolE [Shewanella]MDF0534277.1 lipoprotein-releasing ABC transporter permease subunit LolE [Shewanella sp. A32]QUN07054.1 lipoprotein-releasing ABC transporter permease subunit LolE [Shewanella yunxiaonensis]